MANEYKLAPFSTNLLTLSAISSDELEHVTARLEIYIYDIDPRDIHSRYFLYTSETSPTSQEIPASSVDNYVRTKLDINLDDIPINSGEFVDVTMIMKDQKARFLQSDHCITVGNQIYLPHVRAPQNGECYIGPSEIQFYIKKQPNNNLIAYNVGIYAMDIADDEAVSTLVFYDPKIKNNG